MSTATTDPPTLPPLHKNITTTADGFKESSRKRKKHKQKSRARSKRLRQDSEFPSTSGYCSSGDARGRGRRRKDKKKKREKDRRRRRRSVSRDGSRRKKSDGSEKARRKKKGRIRSVSVDSESGYSSSSEDYLRRRRKRKRKRRTSCSTCSRSSGSSPERSDKGGRSRRRRSSGVRNEIGVKKKDRKNGRRGRYRSPSCSTCSSHRTSSSSTSSRSSIQFRSRGRFTERSQSTEVCGDYEGRVEITQDGADFPYSRSNDSLDGISKNEMRTSQAEKQENARKSSGNTRWGANNNQEVGGDMEEEERAYLHVEANCESQSAGKTSRRLKSVVVVPNADAEVVSETDDLETMLRKKALENLKKFRGSAKPSGQQKDEFVQSDSCGASRLRIEDDDRKSSKEPNMSSKQIPSGSAEEKSEVQDGSFQLENEDKSLNLHREMANLLRSQEQKNRNEFANCQDVSRSPRLITRKNSTTSSSINKGQASPNEVRREHKKQNNNLLRQVPVEHGVSELKTATRSASHTTETNKAKGSTSGLFPVPDYYAQGSTETNKAQVPTEAIKAQESTEAIKAQGTTSKTDTELQNKTMTVMRGGEAVQVNYKVYIPKKTPALARRQLKR